MSLGEKDVVRKFLFAYCGLEMLANKVVSRWRPSLIEALGSEIPGAPVSDLLWPIAQDDRYTDRSLIFSFAAMATLVSRDSATTDTAIFRMIAKARNNLAHGSSAELDRLPHGEATALLLQYLRAVAAALNDPTIFKTGRPDSGPTV